MAEIRAAPPAAAVPARLVIVDDHPLMREGLIARLAADDDLTVCGEASDVEDALALIDAEQPDLAIVDIALKTSFGLDLIRKVAASGQPTRTLVVSAYEESLFAERALRAGALGYLNKQELQGSVIDAVHAVLRGERYLSPAMTQHLVGRAVAGASVPNLGMTLSQRELQVFQLIGRGMSTRQIAQLRTAAGVAAGAGAEVTGVRPAAGPDATHDQSRALAADDAEHDGAEHEQRAENARRARQHRRAGAGAERGLAAAAAERARHVAAFALLQEHDEQQQQADQDVQGREKVVEHNG